MQALLIFFAILLGILLPFGHNWTFLLRYNLMVMLFFAFLSTRFHWRVVEQKHFVLLVFHILIPVAFFLALRPFNPDLAMAVFLIGIAPTAAAAPVIAELLHSRRLEFVTTAVLLSSLVIAFALPLILPLLNIKGVKIEVLTMLKPICIVVFVPLLVSAAFKGLLPKSVLFFLRYKQLGFLLFLLNVYIASANATHYMRYENATGLPLILSIFGMVALIGSILFILGEKLGGKTCPVAASMALGRKNTMFSLWLALTYFNPIVALGPMAYILFQNAFNGWQMYKVGKAT
ncbi:MAG: hypothetical protein KDC44_01755, partial [Phaeodactylibacter sp.]|nr:hypothetical protein [Phaeodactylibacter sp.]